MIDKRCAEVTLDVDALHILYAKVYQYIYQQKLSPMEALAYAVFTDLNYCRRTTAEIMFRHTGKEVTPEQVSVYVQRARKKIRAWTVIQNDNRSPYQGAVFGLSPETADSR